jgi:branched-chain amino acid transport system ATP-binding protein
VAWAGNAQDLLLETALTKSLLGVGSGEVRA